MEKGLNISEQMEDLEFYKMIQKEHSVTSIFQIDEYRMDIAERITDKNIKKQATAVIDLIANELLENERLQDDEEVESNKDDVLPLSFLESEVDDTGDRTMSGSPQPVEFENETLEMPSFEMTEEEKEAMEELLQFNKENRENEDLQNLESRVSNNQKASSLNVNKGINTAKEGLNAFKGFVKGKIENMDAEKLDENWQNFWQITLSILRVFIDYTAVIATVVYKTPAKRNQKKKLDYTLAEASGQFSGKNIMETSQNDAAYRLKVDWLPKLILILSAIFIYNNFWTIGWVTLGIGLIYYFITYFSFDYGGSTLLNTLADHMDAQGVRLKDSYYTNMLVLYRYFDEYQRNLGVTIDERAKITITEDPELGSILHFFVNEDKNITINSLTDQRLTYYKVVPFLDSFTSNAKLQNKRQVAVMLDQILLMPLQRDEDIAELYSKKEEYWDYFPELKALADEKRAEAEALLLKKEREQVHAEVKKIIETKGINENAINVISTIYERKRDWKFNVWNVSENAIEGNKNYLKVRCIFNQNGNISTVNGLKQQLESKFRSQILIKPRQDRGSFDLYVLFKATLDMEALKVEDVKKYNLKDEIYVGNSLTGKLSAKWNFAANHMVVGGKSGSGKSVELINLLTQLSWLKSYDYRTMFITSSSKIGDFVPFAKNGALVSSGVEKQEQIFEYILKLLTEREEAFYAADVDNIKSYNKKYPEKAMKQIILVADEWENSRGTLDSKLAKRLEGLLVQILNIARSSGALVIIGSQSILKGDIGTVIDKMFVKYSGSNNKNILRNIDPEIADYYATLDRKPQGVFFYSSENTPAKQESLFFGDTNYTLIQTPFLKDITPETLPQLQGQEFENEIFNGTPKDEPEVTSYNLNDDDEETTLNATEKIEEETNEAVFKL